MTDFTIPRTWIYDELVDESLLNIHLRDNLNAIWVGTTAGDLDYYVSDTEKARLPKGLLGQFITMDSGVTSPVWGSLVSKRQGGSETVFSTVGTNNYTPTSVKIQMGCINVSTNSSSGATYYGSSILTFPDAFATSPLVFVTAASSNISIINVSATPMTASNCSILLTGSASLTNIQVNWLAIGSP